MRESGLAVRAADVRVRHRRSSRSSSSGSSRCATGTCTDAVVPHPLPVGVGRDHAVRRCCARSRPGSTALTGVEAIANGVNAFRHPQGKNAAKTLGVLGVDRDHALRRRLVSRGADARAAELDRTRSSRRSRAPSSPPARSAASCTTSSRGSTLLILVLAANTSFQGFPRLSALLARDRFAPRQFANLGDRLVFSNGIVVLAGVAAGLLWIYGANTNSLIHLYVIGVFTAFTLSQAGHGALLVARPRRPAGADERSINGVGATATGRRDADRRLHEVRRGSVARHRRDPAARPRDARDPAALPPDRAAAARRRGRGRSAARRRGTRRCSSSRRSTSRPRGALVRAADRAGRRSARSTCRGRGTDPGIRPALVPRSPAASRCSRRSTRDGGAHRRHPRAGLEAAARRVATSSPSSSRSRSGRRSLLEQCRHPLEFALKLRLLAEPGVVVADVPDVGDDAVRTDTRRWSSASSSRASTPRRCAP